MSGYIIHFFVYTLAVIGMLLVAFVLAKNSMLNGGLRKKKDQFLDVEHSLSLSPRKQLHVVRVGDERLLIAADADRTTFLKELKLDKNTQESTQYASSKKSIQNRVDINKETSVMRSILEKINS